MQLSQNAMTVLERRYLKRDEQGDLTETVEQLFERVAHAGAQADLLYDKSCDIAYFLRCDDQPGFSPKFPDADERGASARPAFRLLCAPSGGQHGGDF